MSKKAGGYSLRKKLSIILLGLVIFIAGIQTGKGNFALNWSTSKGGNKHLPANLDYSDVERIYDQLRVSYDGKLTEQQLKDGLKKGLVAATGDPYTEYLPPTEAKEFDEQLSGTFEGIGAELGKDKDTVIIVAPIANMPASKAGLRPKDVIIEINGKNAVGLSIEEARNQIRGPKGTKVKLTILRGTERLEFTITRATINIPSVESEIMDGNIGYLKISRFSEDTARLARQAAEAFRKQPVQGVVLDLRGNPGGYLDAAVHVSSLWLPKDKVILEEKRDGVTIKTFNSTGTATLQGIPTVVLIDEGSASASEITAGALRDNNAATLLGVKSFGKGSVQEPRERNDGSLLKITVARWFTPKGKNIDKEGISPDKEVKRSLEDYQSGNDPQLDAAKAHLQK